LNKSLHGKEKARKRKHYEKRFLPMLLVIAIKVLAFSGRII